MAAKKKSTPGKTKGKKSRCWPPHMVKVVVDFDVEASQGYHDVVTNTVERLTGTQPLTLREFLKEHLAAPQNQGGN